MNHSFIYKLFLYVGTIFLVVYLFPKSGQFKYEFQKGKPWQYENYYAPFDFAILKGQEEIDVERQKVLESSKQYYVFDENVVTNVRNSVFSQFETVIANADHGGLELDDLKAKVDSIISSIYEFGYLESSSREMSNEGMIALRKGNTIQDIHPNRLFKSSDILSFINSKIGIPPFTQAEDLVLNMLYTELKANVRFDENFTNKVLEENLDKISYTKGLVTEKERIIFKGDIVEGDKLLILNSLKSEYESQVWSKSNYNWIVFGYTILVALAFLMLLLFLRKYRTEIFENNNKVTFIFFNISLIVLLVTFVVKYDAKYVYIVPIVMLPLILKAFF